MLKNQRMERSTPSLMIISFSDSRHRLAPGPGPGLGLHYLACIAVRGSCVFSFLPRPRRLPDLGYSFFGRSRQDLASVGGSYGLTLNQGMAHHQSNIQDMSVKSSLICLLLITHSFPSAKFIPVQYRCRPMHYCHFPDPADKQNPFAAPRTAKAAF